MLEYPLMPRCVYEHLADALRLFYTQPPTDHALATIREVVTHATAVWQQCELQRATSTTEFRAHVLRLKLLLAGVYRTLDVVYGLSLPSELL